MIHPQKPWSGSRKNMILGMPLVCVLLGILIYLVFFSIDSGTEDILIAKVIIGILALAFASACLFLLFRDSWWIRLPYNRELFKIISENIEASLTNNGITCLSKENALLAMAPGRQAKTLTIPTRGSDLTLVVEFITRTRNEKGVSRSRILISGISAANRLEALRVKNTLTDMLTEMSYLSYPNQPVRRN
ncbi:MAG: hypothetical protein PHU53_01145 [Thermoplasmata archaeon]|nr:hypothetical protein [Thermoplasmata archaeon]